MDLILWRHADAQSDAVVGETARTLTSRGRRQAANVAAWLEKHLPDSARIIVSPAKQTIQTAEALGRKFKVIAELAPGAQSASLLLAADWPESRHPVVIIGHQPSLGKVASLLLFGEEQEISMRKGAVWWLSNRRREDGHKVTLRAAMCPDYL